jgi:pimeloyl-ACP methyl ester carboxylesterase
MPDTQQEKVARMQWDEFEEKLQATTTRGGKRTASDEQAMREYFGAEEFEDLQRLAQQARLVRSRAPLLGNVIVIPGILGSSLISTSDGDEDLIWINLARLVIGRLERLRLTADGSGDADAKFKISATIIDKRTYTRFMLKLGARWNVLPFAFDWRKDLDHAAGELARFIETNFKNQPVHLVAHSLGGVVARNFIRLNASLWERMRGEGSQGGRLIMMGTPNYGSFTIPQVMTGTEKLVRWLSKVDLSHSLTEVLEITNSFVGTYQLLPAPDKISGATRQIYRQETWGEFPVSETHLNRARDFHEKLKDPATIDPARMAYIAGCNRETLLGMVIVGPGEFRYGTTFEGDGRVPFELGLLERVPTYYVEEDHGNLPRNDHVVAAVDELLEHGLTTALSTRAVVSRALFAAGGHWQRSMGEHQTGADLERIARREKENRADPEERRAAEETLMRAVMGETNPERSLEQMKEKKGREAAAAGGERVRLHIEVVKGDITQISVPVVVVGHYKGVAPINAIGALDKALGYWISQAQQHSMIGGELGQVFFIPVKKGQLAADAVLLAGMGEEGKFSRDDLRYLMLNVTYAISALEARKFATVLIGSGAGNLREDRALRSMLFGMCDALHRLPDELKLNHIVIIERDPARYQRIFETLDVIKREDSAANLDIRVTQRVLTEAQAAARVEEVERPANLPEDTFGPRITIESDGNLFRFSALTREAVIPVREDEVQPFITDGITKRLMESTNKEEQERLGRLLNSLVPQDFQQIFDTDESLTLILDRSTASFPWEMACFTRPDGPAFFGTHLRITRQFRTLLSSRPGIAPQLNDSLRVLVVADPAPEPELQLPGARMEGHAVVRTLNNIKNHWNLNMEVVDCVGDAECNPIDLLSLIQDGGFDVLHFAGHGFFDEKNPSQGGWVLGDGRFLTAREIFRTLRVPRIVFANACFSAVVNRGQAITVEELNKHLAGIAEAFFERGVQNYIGAGWPVQDDLAVRFATTFYENALTGQTLDVAEAEGSSVDEEAASKLRIIDPSTLGESIAEARKRILHDGSTWGAYQHYGQANALMMPKRRNGSEPPSAATKRPVRAAKSRSTSKKKKPAKKSAGKKGKA